MSVLTALVIAVSSISTFASCSVLASYALMSGRPSLSDPSAMIIFLTVSDFMLALAAIVSVKGVKSSVLNGPENHMCTAKVILLVYFSFSSFLWTAAMSHSSYTSVRAMFSARGQHSMTSRVVDYTLWYQLICWGIPVLFCALFTNEEMGKVGGVNGSVCWFAASTEISQIAAAFTLVPLGLIQMYNLHVLRYFSMTLRNFPASGELINSLKRALLIRTVSKLVLLLSFLLCTYLSFTHSPDQYTFPDERSASIGTWILTLFIFFTPALQGIVDAYVFFEKKIFSHGSGMLPISGEDSELDRTDSSVMIGQQRFPVQTCNRQDDDVDDVESYSGGGARKSKKLGSHASYSGLRTKSETDSDSYSADFPTLGEVDNNIEMEMKLEVQSQYSDHLHATSMDEIDLDSTIDDIAVDEEVLGDDSSSSSSSSSSSRNGDLIGKATRTGIDFSYNPIQRR